MPDTPSNLVSTALSYLEAGLCVLPAIPDKKRPALASWKPYRQQLPSAQQVRTWCAQAQGICIVAGAVSGNLEMIDFDGRGVLYKPWADLVNGDAPGLLDRLVIERSPSGGCHVVYRCEAPVAGNQKLAQRAVLGGLGNPATLIETRGEGGLFLCDPTPGYNLQQGLFTGLPVLSAAERDILIEAAQALNEVVAKPEPVPGPTPGPGDAFRPGDDFSERGDVRAVLQKAGWTLVKPGENEYWRRPGKDRGWSATLKDRVFFVFSSNAAPFEPQKAYKPFAVYTILEHGGLFPKAAAALRVAGYGGGPTQDTGTPPATLAPGTATAPPAAVTPPPPELRPLTVQELVRLYENLRPPVIHGLLREGETMNIIASPKTGKSWLVTDLALSIVTGKPWLGRFDCERGAVLIIDNELHGETSANRIPRVAAVRKSDFDVYAKNIWVSNLRGTLRNLMSMESYFAGLKPRQFKVIVLDAFYRFMPVGTNENDNGTMAMLYNYIDRYADMLKCAFVLIHHSSKGNQSDKSITDVGAGAGAQSRATDTHVVLRAHEEDKAVVLDAAVRSWPPVTPFCLRWTFPVWNPADDLNPANLKRQRSPRQPGEKKEEWTPESFVKAFIDDMPRERKAILEMAVSQGVLEYIADRMLRAAKKRGLVVVEGEGKKGAPQTYQLPESSADKEKKS
jgi:hypothetical protein